MTRPHCPDTSREANVFAYGQPLSAGSKAVVVSKFGSHGNYGPRVAAVAHYTLNHYFHSSRSGKMKHVSVASMEGVS
jgi:hypothetical protein